MAEQHFGTVGLGGTFDHLHAGHEFFLHFAADRADLLRIGLTTPTMCTTKAWYHIIQPFAEREQALRNFLVGAKISAEIFSLNDEFGPALMPKSFDALAVTTLTQPTGDLINQKRTTAQLKPLPLLVCPVVPDHRGGTISSSRIRGGEMNRAGYVYADLFPQTRLLTKTQKHFFQPVQGQLVKEPTPTTLGVRRVVIGDVVLEAFCRAGWTYDLGIWDGRTQRDEYHSDVLDRLPITKELTNFAGQISFELVLFLQGYLKQEATREKSAATTTHTATHLKIKGEEDLAAVAAVLCAPLGTHIYYGQPNEGMVQVVVTEELKEKFRVILQAETILAPGRSS